MSSRAPLFLPSTRSQAWSIIIPYLKRSKYLQPVNTWFTWDGDSKHDMRDVVLSNCPALRITPFPNTPTKQIDEISHTTAIIFKHELWIAGTKVTDFMDFWGAIENAWFDGTDGLTALLEFNNNTLRVFNRQITAPVTSALFLAGSVVQYGVGTISLSMDITTGD